MYGERIRQLRIQNNLSQTELGEKLGIAKSTISHYEQENREPSYNILKGLKNIFGVSIGYILGEEEEVPIEIVKQKRVIVIGKRNIYDNKKRLIHSDSIHKIFSNRARIEEILEWAKVDDIDICNVSYLEDEHDSN